MFDVDVIHFSISAKTVVEEKSGYVVKLVYALDFSDEAWGLVEPIAKVCDFREDITFCVWWQQIAGGQTRILHHKDTTIFPSRLIQMGKGNQLAVQTFLRPSFMRPEPDVTVPDGISPEILCRVSLHPVFARRSVRIPVMDTNIVATTIGSAFSESQRAATFEY